MKNLKSSISTTRSIPNLLELLKIKKILFIILFLCGSIAVNSQNLSQFKYSSEQSKGRKIIPFADLQGAVKTLHDVQVTKQKAAAGYNSANLVRDKKLYLGYQEDVIRYLATAARELSAYKGDDSSKKSALEREVKKHEDDLEEIEDKLENLNRKMKDGITKWEAVADARIRVREVWQEAYDEVDDAEDDPEEHIGDEPDDEDDAHDQWEKDLANFKRYTARIKQKIKAGYRTHDEEIKVAEDAVIKLEQGLRLR